MPGEVNALVLAEGASVDDLADDVFAFDGFSTRSSMRPSERRMREPDFEVFGERLEGGADQGGTWVLDQAG